MNTIDKVNYWSSLREDSTAYSTRTYQAPLLHYRSRSKLARWIDKHPRAFAILCGVFAVAVLVVAK